MVIQQGLVICHDQVRKHAEIITGQLNMVYTVYHQDSSLITGFYRHMRRFSIAILALVSSGCDRVCRFRWQHESGCGEVQMAYPVG